MDFETYRKFFDLKHRKKVRMLNRIGAPIAAVGALLVTGGSLINFGFMIAGWAFLVVGVPILAIASSWRVKETDILEIIERERKQFKQECEEKLSFPGDLAVNSLLITGCDAACQKDYGLPTKKLKSGAMLAPIVTFTHLYVKRDRVIVFSRNFSIVEELVQDSKNEILFSEFDQATVEKADNVECKGYSFRILNKGEVVLAAPTFLEDYSVDSYAQNLVHLKERASRR